MKQWWIDRVREALYSALFIMPFPLGLYAVDEETYTLWGFFLFLLLSLGVSLHRKVKEQASQDIGHIRSCMGYFLYAWGIIIMIGMGILDSLTQWVYWQNWMARLAILFVWMWTILFCQQALGTLFIDWFTKRHDTVWGQIGTCIFTIVPFPCAFLGMFLFPTIPPVDFSQGVFAGLLIFIGFFAFLLTALAMLTFACYFFPWKKRYASGVSRLWGLLRILVTAFLWLGVHNIFFMPHGDWYGTVLFTLMPVFQNNPLVFITPVVFESIAVGIAVYGGSIVWRYGNRKNKEETSAS